jgi:hypothetical protein
MPILGTFWRPNRRPCNKPNVYSTKMNFCIKIVYANSIFPKEKTRLKTDAFGAIEMNSILVTFICFIQILKKAKQRVRPLLVCSFKC